MATYKILENKPVYLDYDESYEIIVDVPVGTNLIYKSSDESIAVVTIDGFVSRISDGIALITVNDDLETFTDSILIFTINSEDIYKRLISMIPQYYEKDPFSIAWFKSIARSQAVLNSKSTQLYNTAHPQTADQVSINDFENDFGIVNEPEASLEARIGRVLGKIFIKYNVFNEKYLNILSGILGMGELQVTFDEATGSVAIIVQDVELDSDNFRYFTELTDIWTPAHLNVTAVQPNLIWDQVESEGITWDEMEFVLGFRWFTTAEDGSIERGYLWQQ